jgi:ribosomal protein S6--L-glutamate ligase
LVLTRFAMNQAPFALSIADQFSAQGALVINDGLSISVSRNGVRCLQRLASGGVAVPRTLLAKDVKALKSMVSSVGGLPVQVRLAAVTEERRVMLCESVQALEAALEALLGLGHDVLMQESVRPSDRQFRLLIVDDQVVCALEQIMRPGRAGRNLKLIETLKSVSVSDAVAAIARRAATLCGLALCAVDVKEGRRIVVTDIDPIPHVVEFETVCRVDVVSAIVACGERRLERLGRGRST